MFQKYKWKLEVTIPTTMKTILTPPPMSKISIRVKMEKSDTNTGQVEIYNETALWKAVQWFLSKCKLELSYGRTVLLTSV